MDVNQIISFLSLALSIFFWWNARQQAAAAERTLQEVKSQIIGWQSELNKTAIEMLSSRPEMIAKQTALAESQAESEFTSSLASIIERLSHSNEPQSQEIIQQLLTHHAAVILGKQRNGFEAAMRSSNAGPIT